MARHASDPGMIGSLFNNMGGIYLDQGDYPRALDYYMKSLDILKQLGDKWRISGTQGNIGIIYKHQGDYPMALEYYNLAKQTAEEIGSKGGVARQLVNISTVYKQIGKDSAALENYDQAIRLYDEIGNKYNKANALNNIGSIYDGQGKFRKALEYYERARTLAEEINDNRKIARALYNMGNVYHSLENYSNALQFCKQGLLKSKEMGYLLGEKTSCECLYASYKALGKGDTALMYFERTQVLDDSLKAKETSKKLQRMEFAKEVLADSLENVEKERSVQTAHEDVLKRKNRTRNELLVGGTFFLLLAAGFYGRWRYVKKSRDVISKEKDRSDNLLHNILPADIAEELKTKGKADARDYDLVSILFTDFKGFTSASEKMSAKELMSNINHCFEVFDGICETYEIEKIKTIGDAYMAAGGLPIPSENSSKMTVLAALEMQEHITKLHNEKEAKGEHAFEMRVGIHTGPVVAGIVGVKKFQYDVWGDTVNTASRMESNGKVGKVNISQNTYDILKDDPELTFENRGKIEVKGKGEMEMWFVGLKG